MKTYLFSFIIFFGFGCGVSASLFAQDLSAVVKIAKQAKAKELMDSMKPSTESVPASGTTPAAVAVKKELPSKPLPPPPPPPPTLKAIYGVNGDLQADLFYDGSAVVLTNEESATSLGIWKNSYVFSDGVLLSTTAISRDALDDIAFKAQGQLGRKPVCKFLNFSDKQCLFLTPALAQAGSVAGDKNTGFDEQVRALVRPTATPPMDYRASAGASLGGAAPMPASPSVPAPQATPVSANGGAFSPAPQAAPASNNSPPKAAAFPR